ncbi:SUF system Fe-S cluster assembly regulator [Zooshikella harenae]|uniref:SUF system Fe-S cluster assembly regulator n=1 Tax=Zooshikella harenae TaxID=2827238 RepID=A0ABS5ZDI9_9GAMM|nr:SUF system Fe-S cluster assembly regulator [Zooshikella harenae]MBU2711330.1 SUF system Fe-S cluster assembly regulator [Zooshikella harenae]
MLRISRLADYALIIAHFLQQQASLISLEAIAEKTNIPLATVRKLLRYLVQHQIVKSVRGARGGYLLAKPGNCISVADIIEAIEGPIALTECANITQSCQCELSPHCHLKEPWQQINQQLHITLKKVKLTDINASVSSTQQVSSDALQTITTIEPLPIEPSPVKID